MEVAKVKQEVTSDDSTWDQWEKDVEFDETIKDEDLIHELCSEEVLIKDEFDENSSLHLHTGSGIIHSIPTVCNDVFANQRLDIGKESNIGESPLEGFQNIPEHSNRNVYSSKNCDNNQVIANNLVQNAVINAINRPHMCQICKLTYDNIADHTCERRFECYTCKYITAQKSHLVRHMKTHTDERPFACDVCKYRSALKATLVTHMRTHTGERPFACNVCMYKSAKKQALDTHMRTHTGELHFACSLCKYKTAYNSHLVRHMRTHNGGDRFACYICKYTSAHKKTLVIHMKTHKRC